MSRQGKSKAMNNEKNLKTVFSFQPSHTHKTYAYHQKTIPLQSYAFALFTVMVCADSCTYCQKKYLLLNLKVTSNLVIQIPLV